MLNYLNYFFGYGANQNKRERKQKNKLHFREKNYLIKFVMK